MRALGAYRKIRKAETGRKLNYPKNYAIRAGKRFRELANRGVFSCL